MEVIVATEIAMAMLSENNRCIGMTHRYKAAIPCDAARFAHEITDEVLRNNGENLGQDE